MTAGSDTGNGCASSLTDRLSSSLEPRQQRPPGRVGKRRKVRSSAAVVILNHIVKCRTRVRDCQPARGAVTTPCVELRATEARRPAVDRGDADEDRGHAGKLPRHQTFRRAAAMPSRIGADRNEEGHEQRIGRAGAREDAEVDQIGERRSRAAPSASIAQIAVARRREQRPRPVERAARAAAAAPWTSVSCPVATMTGGSPRNAPRHRPRRTRRSRPRQGRRTRPAHGRRARVSRSGPISTTTPTKPAISPTTRPACSLSSCGQRHARPAR